MGLRASVIWVEVLGLMIRTWKELELAGSCSFMLDYQIAILQAKYIFLQGDLSIGKCETLVCPDCVDLDCRCRRSRSWTLPKQGKCCTENSERSMQRDRSITYLILIALHIINLLYLPKTVD